MRAAVAIGVAVLARLAFAAPAAVAAPGAHRCDVR
jgi:hypothetical protein